MFYPQANPYSQFGFNPQSFIPQGFNPQGYIPQQGHSALGNFNAPAGGIYGYGAQGLQGQHGLQQLLAHQLAPQQFTPPQFADPNALSGPSGFNGASNGIPGTGWTQPHTQFVSQPLFGQINSPQQQQPPQHQLLQQLAHYHYLVAQQLAQLATQQSGQNVLNPMAGQFIPGQQGAPFIPGLTMH